MTWYQLRNNKPSKASRKSSRKLKEPKTLSSNSIASKPSRGGKNPFYQSSSTPAVVFGVVTPATPTTPTPVFYPSRYKSHILIKL